MTDTNSISSKQDNDSNQAYLTQKLEALQKIQRRMEQELDAEIELKRKEMGFKLAIENKRIMLEKQLREEEEQQSILLQDEILRQRKEQIDRMKARQRLFNDETDNLEKEFQNLKNFGKKKRKLKAIIDSDGESDAESNSTRQNRFKRVNFNHDMLRQAGFTPTNAQLAARSGLSKNLPSFSGKPEEWPLFYGSFCASNDACGYSDIENLVRLQDCLKGEALEMVRGHLLLPKSVPKAIEKLRHLYGRPELILKSHLEKVRNLMPPEADKLASFVPFGTAVEQMCEHLEAADMKQHLNNPLLIQELVEKLPDSDKRGWVRFKRNYGEVSLRTFTDFLSEIVEDACEANVKLDFNSVNYSISTNYTETVVSNTDVEVSKFGDGEDEKETKSNMCIVCRRINHSLRDCQEFQNLAYTDRKKIVNHWQLCYMCLNYHGKTPYKFKVNCNIGDCRQGHNALLHPPAGANGTNVHISTDNDILFRMIPVTLHCGEKSISTLAFLDEGSSVSLVEKKLTDRMGINGVPEELTIEWTAGIERIEKGSQRMNLWVSGNNMTEKLFLNTVHAVEKLKLPVQSLNAEQISQQYSHLHGLPISSYSGRPEILIGVNNIQSFAPIDSKIRGAEEPIAVKSKLGWTIYGPRQVLKKERKLPRDP